MKGWEGPVPLPTTSSFPELCRFQARPMYRGRPTFLLIIRTLAGGFLLTLTIEHIVEELAIITLIF